MHRNLFDLDFQKIPPRELEKIMTRGVIRALRAHKAAGVPAIVWDRETGQTIAVPPEQIPDFPDEPTETEDKPG
jgi:hypothetical protein